MGLVSVGDELSREFSRIGRTSWRIVYGRIKKKKDKRKDEDKPRFVVDSISGDTTFLPPADFEYLQLMLKSGTTQQLGQPLMLETNLPLAEVDTAGVHFDIKVDTIWQPLEFKLRPDSLNPLLRSCIDVNWKPGEKYRISVDTMAMRSIYGPFNKPMSQEITVKQLEDYANLNVTLVDLDSVPAVVELLNSSDAPQYRAIKPVGESVVSLTPCSGHILYALVYR